MGTRALSVAILGVVMWGFAAPAGATTTAPAREPVVHDLVTKHDRTATYAAPIAGFLTVRSAASDRSDWDLDLIDAATGRKLAASHGFGSHEVAQTYVTAGPAHPRPGQAPDGRARRLRRLLPALRRRRCRRATAPPSSSSVKYGDDEDLERIEAAGLDLTHDIHGGRAAVIVTGAEQLAALTRPRPAVRGRGRGPQPAGRRRRARPTPRRRRAPATRRCPPAARSTASFRTTRTSSRSSATRQPRPGEARRRCRSGPSRAARSWASRSPRTSTAPTTAARPTSSWACTTPASGHPPRPRWSSRTCSSQGSDSDPRISDLLVASGSWSCRSINVDGFVESREGGALGIPDPGRHDRSDRAADGRGRRAARRLVRLPAQELRRRDPQRQRAVHAAVRRRPEPQLRQRLGRPRRRHRPDHAELPRHRPVLRARDAGRVGVHARARRSRP